VFGTNFDVGPGYEIIGPVGKGAFGIVVAAKVVNFDRTSDHSDEGVSAGDRQEGGDSETSEMVAIKKIMLEGANAGSIRRTLRELKILRLV